jgi:DNA-binding transcriptional ArsR family regulator
VVTYATDAGTDPGADRWAALGDRSRRQIFERLAERPRSVTELARTLPISRPAVSQHLRVLKTADLVRSSPEGTRRIYEVNHDGLRALRAELDEFWSKSLARFKQLAEEQADERTEQSP